MITLTKENKGEFTDMLTKALIDKFGEDIPENYGTEHPWSLLSLIRDDAIDTYQLIYVNDKFWTATGGMIREFGGNKVYQAVFRGFSNAENRHKGLGVVSYTHLYSTKYQIERAKELGCHSVIISFNDYNYKLFDITQKYMLPKTLPEHKFIASDEPIMFNGVEQWLLTLRL
jgi:hypothetical protein